jgi:hypothetical protein
VKAVKLLSVSLCAALTFFAMVLKTVAVTRNAGGVPKHVRGIASGIVG